MGQDLSDLTEKDKGQPCTPRCCSLEDYEDTLQMGRVRIRTWALTTELH